MADLDQISFMLGEIKAGQDRLSKSFEEEKDAALVSRTSIHRRLDEQVEQTHELQTSVMVAGQITAQVRGEVQNLERRINEEVKPTIEEWVRIKQMGLGMAAIIGIGGATIATAIWAFVSYFGEPALVALRRVLRLP